MKNKQNAALKELRRIIGRTQAEFAAMIGASKDTVASWETGRNKVSKTFARRIQHATGVDDRPLLRGRGALFVELPFTGRVPYTAEEFEEHRRTLFGRTDKEAAQHHLERCVDALELIFLAAAVPDAGKIKHRLPAVVDSFIVWCKQTEKDFRLGPQIAEQLSKRSFKHGLTLPFGEWRRLAREDREFMAAVPFRDDSTKSNQEMLTIELEAVPGWAPGRLMRGTSPGIVEVR